MVEVNHATDIMRGAQVLGLIRISIRVGDAVYEVVQVDNRLAVTTAFKVIHRRKIVSIQDIADLGSQVYKVSTRIIEILARVYNLYCSGIDLLGAGLKHNSNGQQHPTGHS